MSDISNVFKNKRNFPNTFQITLICVFYICVPLAISGNSSPIFSAAKFKVVAVRELRLSESNSEDAILFV